MLSFITMRQVRRLNGNPVRITGSIDHTTKTGQMLASVVTDSDSATSKRRRAKMGQMGEIWMTGGLEENRSAVLDEIKRGKSGLGCGGAHFVTDAVK